MSVNLNKMKHRQKEEDAKAAARSQGGFSYWSPTVGENYIRFMPPWTDEGDNADTFYRELYVHWNVGPEDAGVTITCPKNTPYSNVHDCPICEYVQQLRSTGDPVDAETAQRMNSKQRFYSNIVDLQDPTYTSKDVKNWEKNSSDDRECPFKVGDTKIQVYSYGVMVFRMVLDIFASGKDITDLDNGWDIKIKREGKGLKTKYLVRLDMDDGKMQCGFEFIGSKLIEKSLVNLDLLMPFRSDEDMRNALGGISSVKKLTETNNNEEEISIDEKSYSKPKFLDQVKEEDPPPCFKDAEIFDESDAECVGGLGKDGEEYDRCPFFKPCKEACKPTHKKRGRRRAKSVDNSVEELEREMREQLK